MRMGILKTGSLLTQKCKFTASKICSQKVHKLSNDFLGSTLKTLQEKH